MLRSSMINALDAKGVVMLILGIKGIQAATDVISPDVISGINTGIEVATFVLMILVYIKLATHKEKIAALEKNIVAVEERITNRFQSERELFLDAVRAASGH